MTGISRIFNFSQKSDLFYHLNRLTVTAHPCDISVYANSMVSYLSFHDHILHIVTATMLLIIVASTCMRSGTL